MRAGRIPGTPGEGAMKLEVGTHVYFVVSNLYVEQGVVVGCTDGRYTVRVTEENSRHAGPHGVRLCESRLYLSREAAQNTVRPSEFMGRPRRSVWNI